MAFDILEAITSLDEYDIDDIKEKLKTILMMALNGSSKLDAIGEAVGVARSEVFDASIEAAKELLENL